MADLEDEKSILVIAKDTALTPLRIAASKPAQRAYIRTFLIISTSFLLAGIAASAYVLFYYSYIPTRGFSRNVHLQYFMENIPWGNASLDSTIVSGQPYDVRVQLHMPRTPTNTAAGNFMIYLGLMGPADSTGAAEVLASEQRPAILTYYSPVVELVHKVRDLPWYLLGWRHEAEELDIPMMEGVEFTKGWRNLPASLHVQIGSDSKLQFYAIQVHFTARLQGLRYVMYNYRVLSFLVFTTAFWAVEMLFAAGVWFALSFIIFSPKQPTGPPVQTREATSEDSRTVKSEDISGSETAGDLSDTSRTFPTFSRQPPLRYSPSPRVKKEEVDEKDIELLEAVPPAAEADDEDEDADFILNEPGRLGGRSDSGLGTSLESGADPQSARRRKSHLLSGSGPSR